MCILCNLLPNCDIEHGSSLNSEMFLGMRTPLGVCEKCSLQPNPEMLVQGVWDGLGGQVKYSRVFR